MSTNKDEKNQATYYFNNKTEISEVPSNYNDSIKSPNSPSFIGDNELIGKETDDFICKSEKEVVKVPNCTYSNEVKSTSKYFLCTCSTSSKGFDLICEACAQHCHKKHAPTLEVPGANLCSCGLNNHIITPEMKEMFAKKQKSKKEMYVFDIEQQKYLKWLIQF